MNAPPPDEEAPRLALALQATVLYGVFVFIAVTWLWLREREHIVAELAVGEHGPLTSLAVGAVVGFGISGLLVLGARYLPPFAALEDRLKDLVGELSEPEIVVIAMASAIGEEMLFRGALQDQFGLYVMALVFGLLHSGPGLMLWSLLAAGLGLGFGWMVELGYGLLSVTVAHALINFLSLRRMVLP